MGCFLSCLKEKLCLFQQGNLRLNKPQGEMNRNQSFTLLQKKKKKSICINQKPLKSFPTWFFQTPGALEAEDSHWLGQSLCWHPSGGSNPPDLPLISTRAPLLEVPSSNPVTCSPRSVCLWNDIQGKTWHVSRSTFRADLWPGVRVENRLCSVGMDTSSFPSARLNPQAS